MPTYSYRCPECGHDYERLQKISDTTRVKCPECGTTGERQITGGAGIVFKGSGFYITDYKRAGEKRDDTSKADKKSEAKETDKKSTVKDKAKSKTGGDS